MENVGQAFTEGGKVGKQFTEDGKAGETPLSSSESHHRASPAPGWFLMRSLILKTFAVHHKSLTSLRAAGGTAEEIGGPLDKHGKVGKQFTTDGAVGESTTKQSGHLSSLQRRMSHPLGICMERGF